MRPLDLEQFLRNPVGGWVVAGTSLLWCHSPTLCGSVGWGRPDVRATREVLRGFEAYRHLAPQFDVVLDASAIEGVDPESLMAILEWARGHLDELRRRVRLRMGVVPRGMDGLTLAGVSPLLGEPHPVRVTPDAREAFRAVLPDGGDALCDEIATLVTRVRDTPPLLHALRTLLRERHGRLSLGEAARKLAVSSRSLQRQLTQADRSFRAEVLDARFAGATRLLAATDDKVAAIAARLGVTEAALAILIRARTGLPPSEYRKRLRESPTG